MRKNARIDRLLYVTVLVLIGLLYLPRIADFGLFMDGSIYGAIAHNMAIGDGSFWQPMFHNFHALQVEGSAVFYEHPPLMFWMESWAFRLLGDGFEVEKIYGTVILITHIIVLTFFFRALTEKKYSIFAVWPVLLLWYAVPTISWSSPQNMIDNTLSLWALLSIWASFKAVRRDHFLWAILAGLLMGLAVLTKGPMGFFPLTAIALLWLSSFLTRPRGSYSFFRAFYKTIAVIAGFSIVGLNVYIATPAKAFMTQYINQQVIPSVAGHREMESTWAEHFSIIQDMFVEYAPIYGIAILFWIYIRFFRKEKSNIKKTTFPIWLILVGISATLPIALSAKSHSFYLISGVPYFALAVGLYWIDDIIALTQKINLNRRRLNVWTGLVAMIFIFTIYSTTSQWGQFKRDKTQLEDVFRLAEKVNPMTTVGVSEELLDWATLHSNLERHHLIYTTPEWEEQQVMLVSPNVDSLVLNKIIQNGYQKAAGDWQAFWVFER